MVQSKRGAVASTASSRTLPFRDWGGGGAEDGEIGANVSSTTVLNWRAHSLEWAVERRATRLGRMVNDIVTLEGRECARYCVKVDCRGRRPLERSRVLLQGSPMAKPMFSGLGGFGVPEYSCVGRSGEDCGTWGCRISPDQRLQSALRRTKGTPPITARACRL